MDFNLLNKKYTNQVFYHLNTLNFFANYLKKFKICSSTIAKYYDLRSVKYSKYILKPYKNYTL